jgi:hypothetical protein
MKTIELTPAELEMIQLKREQEELAAQEKAALRQIAIEKEIARATLYVKNYMDRSAQQVKAAEEFAKLIPTATYHVDKTERTVNACYDREVVETLKYTESNAYLMLKGYKISVTEHIVYNKWNYRGSSRGYKMYVSGPGIDYKTSNRGYKNGKKVVELIEDTIEARKAQELYKNKQRNAVETAVANLTEQFPNARINSGRGCKINPYGSASNRYTEYDEIVVVLENGIEVKYRVYENGELSRMDLRFPNANATQLLSQLNEMNFSTETVA